MSQKNCMFCGQKATLLCDYIIGYDGEEDSAGVMLAMPKKMHTCDAPMCRECATWHGNLFFSGVKHGMETKDYCPICERLHNLGQNIRNHRIAHVTREPCLTDGQADVIRRAHWGSYSNPHMRHLRSEKGGGQLCMF